MTGKSPNGYTFPESRLRLESDERGWRLLLPGQWDSLPAQENALTFGAIPDQVLHAYEAMPTDAPGYVIAIGRVREGATLTAVVAGDDVVRTRRPDFEPNDSAWQPTASCVLTGGVWGAEVPVSRQWLRIAVDGQSHTWFRPVRPRFTAVG